MTAVRLDYYGLKEGQTMNPLGWTTIVVFFLYFLIRARFFVHLIIWRLPVGVGLASLVLIFIFLLNGNYLKATRSTYSKMM